MRRRALLAAAATATLGGAAGCTALGDDCPSPSTDPAPRDGPWPTNGFDRANTNRAPAGPGPSSERWRYRRGTEGAQYLVGFFSQPLVVDGTVYVAMRKGEAARGREYAGNVLAVDADSGDRRFRTELPRLAAGGLAGRDDRLYVGDAAGVLHALDRATGDVVWSTTLGDRAVGTPTTYGDRVYVVDDAGTLHALTATGDRCFSRSASGVAEGLLGGPDRRAGAAPAVDADHVYAAHGADRGDRRVGVVRAVAHDGSVAWTHEFPTPDDAPNAPTLADGRVVVTGGDRLRVLDADSGDRRGEFVFGYGHAGAPATDGSRAYVGAKNLYAIRLDDPSRAWRVPNLAVDGAGGWADAIPFVARPVVADGTVYHRAAAYDARTGDRRWGSTVDDEVTTGNYATHAYGHQPVAVPTVTPDALYLAHQHRGVVKYA
ncbi:PQQ-binding-like beta-propeller repeat protein [Halorubellus sp. PRR65]|uniref:PQQ-binding-like beta-propeller repeat protein n=1 Tax=Halorubellus sp. PRR65 TaxID=3098148 RepID=UPI002B2631DF|nr:PQQ-binding-like beta-propeller repeat protein [Halorubellus sp. PRR65]